MAAQNNEINTITQEQWLQTPIGDTDLAVRVLRRLDEHGVKTVGDLVQLSREDLLTNLQMGHKAVYYIEEWLSNIDLSLKTI